MRRTLVLILCISPTFQMLLICCERLGTAQIHFPSAVGTEANAGKRVDFLNFGRSMLMPAKLLHQVKLLLSDDRLMGVLENQPVLFRVIHSLLVFVRFHMSAEIHSVTCVFRLFKDMSNGLGAPAVQLGILMPVISSL